MANQKNSKQQKRKQEEIAKGALRDSRVENVLAYMAAAVIGVSLLTMIVTLVALFAGFRGLPPVVGLLPSIGFPAGFLLVLAILVTNLIRRSRANRS
jgi:formate/nitrite transporter FocA (FNT family)